MIHDTIVVGLGAVGSAACYQLARRKCKVLGLDQFSPPHAFGSSHGDTRITRRAIGEGMEYTPLALRSHEIWSEVEKETGKSVFSETGMLVITNGSENVFYKNTVEAARRFGIRHEILSPDDIRRRFPQFKVTDSDAGYFEHDAGFLRPEECIRANLDLAQKYGARIRTDEKVLKFKLSESGEVRVETNHGEKYQARKLIICGGAWVPDLLGPKYSPLFKVTRNLLYWFDFENENSFKMYEPKNCPVYMAKPGPAS